MADAMLVLNERVQAVAEENRWFTRKLEDGERVIQLRGKSGAHAGAWGKDDWYALIPCTSPARRDAIMKAAFPGLKSHSGDVDTLVIGPEAVVLAALRTGQVWARAKRKRAGDASRLLSHQYRQKDATPGASASSDGLNVESLTGLK
jgi:hypothetical protein